MDPPRIHLVVRVVLLATVIGGVVVPVSAGATILAPKVVTCPVDGKKFTVQVIASTNFQGMDRDFRRRTTGISFYEVIVWTCPGNYYSGYRGDFAVNLDEALKKKIRGELRPRVKLGLIDLGPFRIGSSSIWAQYELAARVFEWRGEPEAKIAHAYLRASYFLKSPEAKVGQGPDGSLDRRSLLTEMRLKAAIWFMLAFDLKKAEGKGLADLAYCWGAASPYRTVPGRASLVRPGSVFRKCGTSWAPEMDRRAAQPCRRRGFVRVRQWTAQEVVPH